MGHLANSCVNTDLGFHSTDLGFHSAAHQKNRTTEKPSWISLSKKLTNLAGKLRPGLTSGDSDQLGPRQSTVALACATDLSEQKS